MAATLARPLLRLAREQLRLSAAELAARCGVTKPYVLQVESGRARGSAAYRSRILEILGAHAEVVFFRDQIEDSKEL